MINFFPIIFLSLISYSVSAAEDVNNSKVIDVCNANVAFMADVKNADKNITLSDSASLHMKQYLSEKEPSGYKVASNVICQKLNGIEYTGSAKEWQGFINNTISGLMKKGGENLQFTLVGSNDSHYASDYVSTFDHREYIINGVFNKHEQIIYNLAVLDKKNNTMYTLVVSGGKVVNEEIKQEFKRLVKSFTL